MEPRTRKDRARDWMGRNRFKLGGFVAGSFGTLLFALFVTVLVTGEPVGRTFVASEDVVFPNF